MMPAPRARMNTRALTRALAACSLLAIMLTTTTASSLQSCSNRTGWKAGVILGNGQMAPVGTVPSAADCCSRCSSTAGCACWTYVTSDDAQKALQCILKSTADCKGSKAMAKRISGTSTPQPPSPPSPPPPPPTPSPPAPSPGNVVVHVVPPTAPLPVNGIAEWTVTIDNLIDSMPAASPGSVWEALNITLDLSPPPGAAPYNAPHRGFSYDGVSDNSPLSSLLVCFCGYLEDIHGGSVPGGGGGGGGGGRSHQCSPLEFFFFFQRLLAS